MCRCVFAVAPPPSVLCASWPSLVVCSPAALCRCVWVPCVCVCACLFVLPHHAPHAVCLLLLLCFLWPPHHTGWAPPPYIYLIMCTTPFPPRCFLSVLRQCCTFFERRCVVRCAVPAAVLCAVSLCRRVCVCVRCVVVWVAGDDDALCVLCLTPFETQAPLCDWCVVGM